MTEILFHAHSGLRYLVLLVGIVALGYALFGWMRRRPFDRSASTLGRVFVGVVDLQLLLGLVLVFVVPFYPALTGHIVMMILAAAVAHFASALARRQREGANGYAMLVAGIALAMVLMIGGIRAIGRSIV